MELNIMRAHRLGRAARQRRVMLDLQELRRREREDMRSYLEDLRLERWSVSWWSPSEAVVL